MVGAVGVAAAAGPSRLLLAPVASILTCTGAPSSRLLAARPVGRRARRVARRRGAGIRWGPVEAATTSAAAAPGAAQAAPAATLEVGAPARLTCDQRVELVDELGQEGLALLAPRRQAGYITGLLEQPTELDAGVVRARIPNQKWNIKAKALGQQNQWRPLIITDTNAPEPLVSDVGDRLEADEIVHLVGHDPIGWLLLLLLVVVEVEVEGGVSVSLVPWLVCGQSINDVFALSVVIITTKMLLLSLN